MVATTQTVTEAVFGAFKAELATSRADSQPQ